MRYPVRAEHAALAAQVIYAAQNARAPRVELLHSEAVSGVGSTVGVPDVTQAIALLDPTILAINAQAGLLSATDSQTWSGVVSGWIQLQSDWATLTEWWQLPTTAQSQASSTMGKVQNYQALAATYNAKLVAAGGHGVIVPNANPPPSSGPAGAPGGSWICNVFGIGCPDAGGSSDTANAFKWAAVLGIVLVGAWYLGPLVASIAGVGAGAIRKRVAPGGFGDEVEGDDLNAYGFGSMARGADMGGFNFADVGIAEMTEHLRGSSGSGDTDADDLAGLLGPGGV